MNINDIPPALTGNKLLEAIKESGQQRQPIAEGLLYEKTCLMISSDPGIGKSTLSTQVAVELAAGLPVFGYFAVPRPVQVFYIVTERIALEILERMKVIGKTYPIDKDNLIITDEYQRLNLLNTEHADLMIKCIKRNGTYARVVFFDPIYSTVSGGLSKDAPASAFTKVMSLLQKEIGCTLWLNHHTVKTQYDRDGQQIVRQDAFYGSQWLKAHITGSYNLKQTEEGVTFVCKKDNYNLLAKEIPLEYDPETELSWLSDQAKFSGKDRLLHF